VSCRSQVSGPATRRCIPMLVSPTVYILDETKSNWSAEQEKGISTIYPFDLQPSGPDDYVARTYLQFLWLPSVRSFSNSQAFRSNCLQSIMPLAYLIPSLRRVEAPSTASATHPHPMHALLEPLLLTTRAVTHKYHSELVQILANGGGAGEMEEAMMWYAVEHEKPADVDGLPGPSTQKNGHDGEEGQWTDENWRGQYLERMERREYVPFSSLSKCSLQPKAEFKYKFCSTCSKSLFQGPVLNHLLWSLMTPRKRQGQQCGNGPPDTNPLNQS
jgi:hypothetical protein